MNSAELKNLLYEEIPLAKAMGVEINTSNASSTSVMAPLALNRNHLDTAFGGSLSSLLILSCYAWLFHRLSEEGYHSHVLIQEAHTDYLLPVKEDLIAVCKSPSEEDFEKFKESFRRKNVGRITLHAEISTSEGKCCTFRGLFVAQKSV
jgi:thioesterase domain-containing protein